MIDLEIPPDRSEISVPLFDLNPMIIGGFELRGRACVPLDKPTLRGWVQALQVAIGSHEASPYWIADLMAYSSTREEWSSRLDQAISLTGLARQTLFNLGYIGRNVHERERLVSPSIGHSQAVARLTSEEQRALLIQARDSEWTVAELRREVGLVNRARVIEGQAILAGQYHVLYADPPWRYGDTPPSRSGASSHYPTMTVAELCALPVAAHARPHSVLFLWVTSPLLMQNPGPRDVIEAWGFTYKSSLVWDKVQHGFGHYVSVRHELLLICTRGRATPDHPTPMVDSVFTERQDGEHSAKPESVRRIIERLYEPPYLELFGRRAVEGWTVFGNDARLWAEGHQAGTAKAPAEALAVR